MNGNNMKNMKGGKKMSVEALSDITKIVVETDEEEAKIIAVITADDVEVVEGFRVRLTPKYE